MTKESKGRDRCTSYINHNGLIYVCGKFKGHKDEHLVSLSWNVGDNGY